MKLSYLNILSCYLPLNILLLSSQINIQWNHYNTTQIQNIKLTTTSTRLLCECDLYTSIYDNDTDMKKVKENFNKKAEQRFHEYDDRVIKNRQKCKEQCDIDIQKIILKDKIGKQLTYKLSTLQTDISSDDIPTCVFEKSLADKVGKICLKSGYDLGSNVPLLGLISGIEFYTVALQRATEVATAAGEKAAFKAAITAIEKTIRDAIISSSISIVNDPYSPLLHGESAANVLVPALSAEFRASGSLNPVSLMSSYLKVSSTIEGINPISTEAINAAKDSLFTAAASGAGASEKIGPAVAASTKQATMGKIFTFENFFSSSLGISIIVMLSIAVILLIIYLILKYNRKRRITKKLNYIKLLIS
ncbi:PIR protein, putative [Plasmodium sp. gorilla clade G1]|nr:PIR protein, putative [Plasmodium sp. gorilla clade G1]